MKPSEFDTFSITFGEGRHLYWFTCSRNLRLGLKIRAHRYHVQEVKELDANGGRVSILQNVDYDVIDEPYPERTYDRRWVPLVERSISRRLYKYQKDGACWMASRISSGKSCLLADEPGLGKTMQAIATISSTMKYPALIVCPSSLKEQWRREFFWASPSPQCFIVDGKTGFIPPAHIVIVNYDLLRYRARQLSEIAFKVVVYDECQALKEPNASKHHRASLATALAHKIGCQIHMTGTPVMNRPYELWRTLHMMDKNEWPDFKEFRRRYCNARSLEDHERGRRKIVQNKRGTLVRIEELHSRINPYVLRRLKHQVISDFPEKRRSSISVTVDGDTMLHYKAAEKDVVMWLKKLGKADRASRASKAAAIVKITWLRKLAAIAKMRGAIPAYLHRWFSRESRYPLVVFGYHRDVMKELYSVCGRLGLHASVIWGDEPAHDRQRQIDMFQAGWSDIILVPIMAAGAGINLQRASDVLITERLFNPAQLEQAEDRVHRIGQQNPVTITYIDAAGTVDEYIRDVLEQKTALVNATIDGIVHSLDTQLHPISEEYVAMSTAQRLVDSLGR